MTTQVELVYVLKKAEGTDRFDSELPVRIPIQGEVEFLPPDLMKSEAASAVMGITQEDSTSRPQFVRLSQVDVLSFPDVSEFRKFRFRILTFLDDPGGQREIGVSYDILKSRYNAETAPGSPLPGDDWLVLVTCESGEFKLLLRKQSGGGPGGGDPCDELGCVQSAPWCNKIRCWNRGCQII